MPYSVASVGVEPISEGDLQANLSTAKEEQYGPHRFLMRAVLLQEESVVGEGYVVLMVPFKPFG